MTEQLPSYDNESQTDDNCVRLDNKTAYALNVIYELLMRNNQKNALKALQELRINGRLFDSQKYFSDM